MLRRYPVLFLLAFVIIGIVVADQFRLSAEILLIISVASCLFGMIIIRFQRTLSVILLGLSLGAFGAFQFSLSTYDRGPSDLSLHFEDGGRYRIVGEVSDWPLIRTHSTDIPLEIDSIFSGETGIKATGKLLIRVSDTTTEVQRGDRLILTDRISKIRGGPSLTGFSYRRFLKLKGIVGVVYKTNLHDVLIDQADRSGMFTGVDHVRRAIVASFGRHLSPSSAALASGFLIGETRGIPPEIYQMFRDSGTLHLLAVSGSNVALVVMFMIFILRPFRLPRQLRTVILWFAILFFAWLSYNEPSVIRASLMASLILFAGIVERRYDLNHVIGLTALIVLLVVPAQLFSVGFQLSFAVAWGLILTVPVLHNRVLALRQAKWLRWILLPLIVSLVAQIFSAPLTLHYFSRLPLISPLANLLIVPMVSLAVVGSQALLLVDLLVPFLAGYVGLVLDGLMNLIVGLLLAMGGEAMPVLEGMQIGVIETLAALAFLALGALSLSNRSLRKPLVVAVLVAVNLVLIQHSWVSFGDSQKEDIIVLPIPSGVAAIVKCEQTTIGDLIIFGGKDRKYRLDESILIPQLTSAGIEQLRYVIICTRDFKALEDFLRLATKLKARRILMPDFLHASALDIIYQSDDSGLAQILTFPVDPGAFDTTAYYLDDNHICFAVEDIFVGFGTDPTGLNELTPESGRRIWITPYLDDKGLLEAADKFDAIACSRIAQMADEKAILSENGFGTFDEIVLIDMSLSGAVRVERQENVDSSVIFTPYR